MLTCLLNVWGGGGGGGGVFAIDGLTDTYKPKIAQMKPSIAEPIGA